MEEYVPGIWYGGVDTEASRAFFGEPDGDLNPDGEAENLKKSKNKKAKRKAVAAARLDYKTAAEDYKLELEQRLLGPEDSEVVVAELDEKYAILSITERLAQMQAVGKKLGFA